MSHLSFRRIWAVVWKDWIDLKKNRAMLWSMLALPAVIVMVPIGVVVTYARAPNDSSLRYMAQYYDSGVAAGDAVRFLIDKILMDWFVLYLIMPVFVPILISSHAIAGEKEKRTLEPLLASPITPLELVMGKSLASLMPAFAICVLAYIALSIGVDIAAWELSHELILPNAMWSFGVFVISPLFAFFGNGIAVLISARVGDSRLAQQLSGLFVLPLVGLAAGQFAGWLRAGFAYYVGLSIFVLLLDMVLVLLTTRLFDRDRLMTRWG